MPQVTRIIYGYHQLEIFGLHTWTTGIPCNQIALGWREDFLKVNVRFRNVCTFSFVKEFFTLSGAPPGNARGVVSPSDVDISAREVLV